MKFVFLFLYIGIFTARAQDDPVPEPVAEDPVEETSGEAPKPALFVVPPDLPPEIDEPMRESEEPTLLIQPRPHVDPIDIEIMPVVELRPEVEVKPGTEIPVKTERPPDTELRPVFPLPEIFYERQPTDGEERYDDRRMFFAQNSSMPEAVPVEMEVCEPITCSMPLKNRINSWLCEYTKYRTESLAWKDQVEEWWAGCAESDDDTPIWGPSYTCLNASKIKCKRSAKRECTTDLLGCNMCKCTDGRYKDAGVLLTLWQRETAMFKERFEIYKRLVESCPGGSEEVECEDNPDSIDAPGGLGSGAADPDSMGIFEELGSGAADPDSMGMPGEVRSGAADPDSMVRPGE